MVDHAVPSELSDAPELPELPGLAEVHGPLGALPFVERHIGLREADVATMLDRLGFGSLE